MALQTRPLLADRDDDLGHYQPLSITAIFAFGVVLLFTVLVLVLTVVGLISRKPVMELSIIVLDLIGLGLAFVARWQIKNAEGTLAGSRLTKIAIGLGIVFGCVYVAYYWGNSLAIRQQAREFTGDWLKLLEKKDFRGAFFYNIEPPQREGRDPAQIALSHRDKYVVFQNIELCRLFDRAKPGEVLVQPQGVIDWQPTMDGLVVTLAYTLRTREGEFDMVVGVIGSEAPDVGGRQWHVRETSSFFRGKRYTTFGRLMAELNVDGHQFSQDWLNLKLNMNQTVDMYLDTQHLPVQQRRDRRDVLVAESVVGLPIAAFTTPGGGLQVAASIGACFVPNGYSRLTYVQYEDEFQKQIEFKDPPPTAPAVSPEVRELLRTRILRPGVVQLGMSIPDPEATTVRIEITPETIRCRSPLDFLLPTIPAYRSRGELVIESENPVLIAEMNRLATEPWDPNQPVTPDRRDSVLKSMNIVPEWRVVKLIVGLERMTGDPRPGADRPINAPPQ